jgi:hypothetical protein
MNHFLVFPDIFMVASFEPFQDIINSIFWSAFNHAIILSFPRNSALPLSALNSLYLENFIAIILANTQKIICRVIFTTK